MGNYYQQSRTCSIGIDTAYLYIAYGGKPRKIAITGKIKNKINMGIWNKSARWTMCRYFCRYCVDNSLLCRYCVDIVS